MEIDVVIKVGICNMSDKQADNMEKMLSDILSRYDQWEIVQFTVDRLRESILDGCFDCRVLLLDIFETDAGDIRRLLDDRGINTDVIYITEKQDRVMESYKGRTCTYIMKPLHDSDMRREISRYFKEQNIQQRCLRITFAGVESYIPIDSIRYIESDHRKLYIHTDKEIYEYYSRLDDIEKELAGAHFVRCHQSYLIAIPYITDLKENAVYVDGERVSMSRRYRPLIQSVVYQAELADDCKTEIFVNAGTHRLNNAKGSLICVKGEYMGKIVRLVPEQEIVVGRSGETADVVVNLPQVSRVHCRITYHEDGDYYEVKDCSTNGTFLDDGELMRRGDTYAVKPGTNIVFGDDRYIYRLG